MYEDLIRKLRTKSLYKDKAVIENMDLCMEAAEAIEHLQEMVAKAYCELGNSLVPLESVVDIDTQTKKNNAAMRKVIDFIMGD